MNFRGLIPQTSQVQGRMGNHENICAFEYGRSGFRFEQVFKFYESCVDEMLRMCLRAITRTPGNADADVFSVFHNESLSKAVKYRWHMDFSIMMFLFFKDLFKEVAAGSSVLTSAWSINEEQKRRMQRLKKLKEMDVK